MQVNLDIADAGITVGDKGILLSIADNSGSVLGHLRIGNSAVEWRKGASRAGRGKKIPLQQFLAALEESIEGGGSGSAAPAKRASKATKAAKAAPAPVKRGRGRPRKNAAAPARPAAKRASRRAAAVDTQAVRAWAQAQGLQISTRGRLPGSVLEQYRQANS
ncbi:Lsr2 family DNA-binding protein [Fodinicola acaciae]|uniref:Lsr2 family DNA-binding protein n=1 Tax=Fodinicola acaciae TaxID=2681555 RepID=UPI0013D1E0B1|nr:histone-like nucleoid-structuring protein Lsr2 [Fodinicola acaciae]